MSAPARSMNNRDTLPSWDLSDLYSGMESAALKADVEEAATASQAFRQHYEGTLLDINGDALAKAVTEYERIQEILGKIGSYAQLIYASDMSDGVHGRFYQSMSEKINHISLDLLFFSLEINRISDEALEAKLAESSALARYWPFLREVRLMRPHQLSDEAEALLTEKELTSAQAWIRLFDETVAGLSFTVDGQTLSLEQAADKLSSADPAARKAAAKEIGRVLGDNIRLFAHVTNTLAKDKQLEDGWRAFPRPISSRNLANQVEDVVAEALISSVKKAYPKLAHRYYQWKARQLGLGDGEDGSMPYWDRNAPLLGQPDTRYSWDEAVNIVLDAYEAFSPEMRRLGEKFFANHWIDVPPRPGKSPGAFAHPTVPSVHPYLLLNYQGKPRDVMTLAHELGHGVHQLLAAEQGMLMADTPLTLAETASVFGEQLTFQSLLKRETNPQHRTFLIAGKVEDMLNTVVRQVAFCEFERKLHDARREGELSPEDIGALWMSVQAESLGPVFRFEEEYQYFWAYIPHFIHSPFYVYAYAFGDCLVNALYALYHEGYNGFEEKYFQMLKAGGTLHHTELLAPFGLDASKPDFWQKGLGIIEKMIDELVA